MDNQHVQQLQGEGHRRGREATSEAFCQHLEHWVRAHTLMGRGCVICLLVVCLPLSFTQPPKLVVNGRGGFKTATRRLQAIRHDAWHRMECGSGSIGKQIVHIPLSSVEQTRYRDEGAAPKFMKTRVV